MKDFEGREVQVLPIYYTKMKKGESPNDLSTDVTSTLTAYAAMANDFNEMGKVIDVLELGRDMLREREIVQVRGGKPLAEKFKSVGRKVESVLTKSGDETRFMQRLNDFFEMQVYGRYMADEGTFGNTKIDKGSSNTNAEERARKVEESYQNARNAKPGSIAAKANMVRDFDERNKKK